MDDALKEAFRCGYLAGFGDSGEGYNGEWGPPQPYALDPEVRGGMEKRLAEFEKEHDSK